MPRKKTPQSSISKKRTRKAVPVWEDYFDILSYRQLPMSIAGIDKIGQELIKWAKNNKNATVYSEFFTDHGISGSTRERWRKRSKDFDAACAYALEKVGIRREKGAINRKLDGNLIMKSMPMYSKEWRALEEWRSGLKVQEQDQKVTTFNIQMPSFNKDEDDKSGKSS